ncbi:sensor histidine kinase [Georgenia sp. 311]|uniref:histidine kinase n=1 Tax=Georgenia wutianyii TaxID=2585135 RepID=A0ABX5VIN5_9MICO|nr:MULTISPECIES: sensor histidine kinase [Georgenia]QDB78144.1 sensor histidine kinase [Georgenia wutianyii]TNC17589.1 sensor histidine kinase [Georgenia sp. 311]
MEGATVTTAARVSRVRILVGRLWHDLAYVMPGLPLAVVSFVVLLTLTTVSLATVVVWVGAVLMPLALAVASRFAGLSRRRLRAWGVSMPPARYRPVGSGPLGTLRLLTDSRRWLDFVFESVVALPLRFLTFVVAVAWAGVALGGLTFWIWALVMPEAASGWPHLLGSVLIGVPQGGWGAYLLDSGINLVLGALALLALPTVVRGLAVADALVTSAMLGGDVEQDRGEVPGDGARLPAVSATAWAWVGASFTGAALLAVEWPVLVIVYGLNPALAMVLAAGQSAALVLAVRWAWPAIGLSTLSALGTMVATSEVATDSSAPWPWPVPALVGYCLLVALIGLRHRWFWAAVAWTAGAAATVVAFLVVGEVPDAGLANGIVLLAVSGGLALLGALGRLWTRNTDRAEEAERLGAEEAQRRRDLEERNRIARELHDVVAHSMSVINVQASTARYRKPGMSQDVQQEFDDIAASSRQALEEMRALLSILRNDHDAPTAPAPRLGDIPELVEATRASGAAITYAGTGPDVPPTAGLTVYRVVQEALSNALRHAPGATIDVTTAVGNGVVAVSVVNAAPKGRREPAPGSGLGLAGIRERVTALGGTVSAGPTAHGGFAVEAAVPLAGADTDGA